MEHITPPTGKPGGITNEKRALLAVTAILIKSPLSAEAMVAVALNAAVAIIAKMPGVEGKRGKVINAMTDEFRKRLQHYLPR